ncbi:MAG: SlyX family protein [Phreatobacter sp.]|uniref:SlyX family protein n=1 Tax=Phreatobacter sp. TaxID=1966341 RepID=UPI001A4B84B5|nr:SlyX family protein [Phreatobacter sp.]MBL8567505.1 SlyX family protein [Phreatobacter sp.]
MTGIADLLSRLEALEVRAAYQDQTVEELNETITAQWREIDRLKRLIERLEDQVREAEARSSGPQAPEPPPPHY